MGMTDFVKKHYKYIILIGIILTIIFIGYRACNIYDKYSELRGQYDTLKSQAKENKAEAERVITEKKEEIFRLNEKIHESSTAISELESRIDDKSTRIDKLESEYATLTDKDKKIENLESQVATWKQKFTIAQDIIKEKDKIIFNLTDKYEAQLKITNEYKALYTKEIQLRELCEKRLSLCDRKTRLFKFGSGITTAILIGGGLYILLK